MSNDYYLYLRCVASRWSSSYYYGSDSWRGIIELDQETQSLYDKISSTATSISGKLNTFHPNRTDYVKNAEKTINEIFGELSEVWSGKI